MRRLIFSALCLSLSLSVSRHDPCAAEAAVIKDFALKDYVGEPWSLQQAEGKLVAVVFLGVECPLVQQYAERIEQIKQDYAERDVLVVGINSNQQDSLAEMAAFARRQNLTFPLLKDPGNQVADQFGAERTPEVFLLDRDRRVRYRGRIDDQYTYGRHRPEAKRHFLREAIDQLLEGKEVATPSTKTVGCHIGRLLKPQADSQVTYSNQIARLLQDRCVQCHREGEIGPFPLTSYDETVGWAEMILEVTFERRMPPWHASPEHGKFKNDARLTDEELDLLEAWVDAGAPEGDPAELPEPRQFETDWRIGKPDLEIFMRDDSFQVPARGEVKYQYFSPEYTFEEDTWIQAAECRPGNRAVVHHIIVGIRGEKDPGVHGRRSEWLAATAPGALPMALPPGHAKLIPAGSRLVFQMHYTPNGTAQEDRSSVGLKLADPKTVKHLVATHQAANARFRIPPGADNHEVKATYTFREDAMLMSMFPHMHLRGKAFRYEALFPGAEQPETLLQVDPYDFNWQNSYVLEQPRRMPAGTQLICTAHFDNSEENLANPDSTAEVRWGDQTWEEMMIGYFDLYDAEAESRAEEFEEGAAKINVEPLRTAAGKALDSDESFEAFAKLLGEALPQVERVDVIAVDGDQMRIERLAQPRSVRRQLGAKITVGTRGMAIPKVAEGSEPVVHNDLSTARGADLRFMQRAMAASAHYPIQLDGQPAALNFWSSHRDAFPAGVQQVLAELAAAVTP